MAVLFVTSKPQESVQAVWLAALGIAIAAGPKNPRRTLHAAVLGAVLLTAAAVYYLRTSTSLRIAALYDAVFEEVLAHSPDPAADLAELGAPASWYSYSGTNAFQPSSPAKKLGFQQEFLRTIGYRKLARFYMRHPRRALGLLRRVSTAAFTLRPYYLGNFTQESGATPGAQSKTFSLWSAFKARAGPQGPWLLPVLWTVNLVTCLRYLRHRARGSSRLPALAVLILVLMGVTEILVCTFGDSVGDVARHLHSFNAMTDLLLAADATWLASLAASVFRVRSRADDSAAATAG